MILEHLGYIELPPHVRKGGFDHAAYNRGDGLLYVAHTSNDAVDVIDCAADRYLHSISGLTGAAGVLTAQERDLVFTSNRADDTVGIFASDDHNHLAKVPVGHRPNGLAHVLAPWSAGCERRRPGHTGFGDCFDRRCRSEIGGRERAHAGAHTLGNV